MTGGDVPHENQAIKDAAAFLTVKRHIEKQITQPD